MLPKVFIGSSTEGVDIAEAVAELLDGSAEATIWTEDVFKPGMGTLQTLVSEASKYDFALFVMSADDVVRSRGSEQLGPRDNVVFELGLFMGSLGAPRTFMLVDAAQEAKIPSDLFGITTLTYKAKDEGHVISAVGSATSRLKRRVRELGLRRGPVQENPQIYWVGPHTNTTRNSEASSLLRQAGITVALPSELVPSPASHGHASRAATVRSACQRALSESDLAVVDLDAYGLDSAWEIGYAEALGIRVLGVTTDATIDTPRPVHRRPYRDNFMHGWDQSVVVERLDDAIQACEGKVVHICGSFRNESAMAQLRQSRLATVAKELILPKDIVTLGNEYPRNYLWRARAEAIQLQAQSEVMMAILPRYGMDTSWQLGYAVGLQKETIGWLTTDAGTAFEDATVWDHWMHGWKQKLWVTSLLDLAAVIHGLCRGKTST